MAVTSTWTSPETGGAIDLNTNDVLTETVWDAVLSNLYCIAGTAGPGRIYNSSQGVLPASGFPIIGNCMGAVANDWHVEGGSQSLAGAASASITLGNSFGSSGYFIAAVSRSNGGAPLVESRASGTFVLKNNALATDELYWIAIGAD